MSISSPNNLLNFLKCHGRSIKESVQNFTKIRRVTDLSVKLDKSTGNNRDTLSYHCNGKGLSKNDTKAKTTCKMFDTFKNFKVLNLYM